MERLRGQGSKRSIFDQTSQGTTWPRAGHWRWRSSTDRKPCPRRGQDPEPEDSNCVAGRGGDKEFPGKHVEEFPGGQRRLQKGNGASGKAVPCRRSVSAGGSGGRRSGSVSLCTRRCAASTRTPGGKKAPGGTQPAEKDKDQAARPPRLQRGSEPDIKIQHASQTLP